MDYVRLALVAINSAAFLALGILSVGHHQKETYTSIRRLWGITALLCGAVVVGSLQRLALQGVAVGWLPESVKEVATGDLQLVQSLVVLAVIGIVFATVKRLADAMDASDRLTDSLLDRVRHIDVDNLHITAREREVLAMIGEGITSDVDLAARLYISPSTVQSHIKSLLRKTGLNRRTDLVAVAVLVTSGEARPN